MYTDPNNIVTAQNISRRVVIAPPDTTNANPAPEPAAIEKYGDDMRGVAHNIATRFKKKKKFSGKSGEDLNEMISSCIDAANNCNLAYEEEVPLYLKYIWRRSSILLRS